MEILAKTSTKASFAFPSLHPAGRGLSSGWSANSFIMVSMRILLPSANEVWGKVICLHLFVIRSQGSAIPACLAAGGCLVGGSAPGGMPGLEGCLVRGDAWSGGVPGQGGLLWGGVPGGDPPNGYCCGRYTSYWNAFLLLVQFCVRSTTHLENSTEL